MTITPQQIQQACGCTLPRAENWCSALNDAMGIFGIDSPERTAAFLAQVAYESGRLAYVHEIWGPTPAQLRYEGRADLGNITPGDGFRYLGRGLIQITGRANYCAARDGLGAYVTGTPDFEAQPEALEVPRWAALSAAWYWFAHGCNALADGDQFMTITKRINGGLNGYDDRVALWNGAMAALA